MSVDSALDYIERMRSDDDFRRLVNEFSEDEEAGWTFVRDAGYDFSMTEFKQAQDAMYKKHGVTPM